MPWSPGAFVAARVPRFAGSPAHAATSNREHDFDTIIVLQLKIIMPAARDDLTINLNGDPPIAQAHFLQQHRHRYRCPEAFFLTVE